MMRTTAARTLLADRQYNIEFHQYLSNHVKHALIALDRLDAPESRVQEYWDNYTKLTPYSLVLDPVEQPNWDAVAVPADMATQWKDGSLRGKKTRWQEQVAFLNDELKTRFHGDTNKLVAAYAPDLITTGIAGGLTHGIIHLGWAIDAQSPWMITEGLAYLNFCHVGIDPSTFTWNDKGSDDGEAGPMDSLVRVAKTYQAENLEVTWIDRVKAKYDESFHPELVPAGFQWHLAKVLHEPHAVATTMPSWLSTIESDELWETMYRTTVYLYLATRSQPTEEDPETHGNFLVLHLMTSLWALEHTVKAISVGADASTDMKDLTRKALGQFYASVVAVVSAAASGFPPAQALMDIQTEFPASANTAADPKAVDWAPTVKAGIAEEEEHNIKLVYVMRELWNRYGYWNGFYEAAKSFTLTPNIGPSKETSTFKA